MDLKVSLRAPPNFSRPHLHASAATLSADDVPAFFIDSSDQAVHAITRQALLPGRTQTYMNAYAHGVIRSFIERRLAKKNSKATTSSKLEVLEKGLERARKEGRSAAGVPVDPQVLGETIIALRAEFGLPPSKIHHAPRSRPTSQDVSNTDEPLPMYQAQAAANSQVSLAPSYQTTI